MSKLKFIILSSLVFALTTGCSDQMLENTSSNQELGTIVTRPGITIVSEQEMTLLTTTQTVYVPIYSEIYDLNSNRSFQLTATLSIRNTDLNNSIVVERVDYYNSSGEKVNTYLTQPIKLSPLASTEVVIAQDNKSGGVGANFIIQWGANSQVNQPLIEAIMISTVSQQGISFVSKGQVIEDNQEAIAP